MGTLDRHPSGLLLTVTFIAAVIVHVYMISDLRILQRNSRSFSTRKSLAMRLTNTWRPPVIKKVPQPIRKQVVKKIPATPVKRARRTEPKPLKQTEPQPEIQTRVVSVPQQKPENTPEAKAPIPVKPPNRPDVNPTIKPIPPVVKAERIKDTAPQQEVMNTADKAVVETPQVQPARHTPEKPDVLEQPEKAAPMPEAEHIEKQEVDWNGLVNRFIGEIDIRDYYPAAARRRRRQGTVVLKVVLSQGATISEVTVAGPSRYASLDNAALDLIRANRADLENILKAGNVELDKPTVLRLPIHFRLR